MNECCVTCGADRLAFLGTLGNRDHYRCQACGMDQSRPYQETFAQWADKRLELRLQDKQRRKKGRAS